MSAVKARDANPPARLESVESEPDSESGRGAAAGLEEQIDAVAALDEPVRRALFFHVAGSAGEVSREDAATATGVSRTLAGFHLDRLVAEGLLEVTFRRLSGRQGPGAGRPAKLYRRSTRQLELTLPPRRYELAARLLAAAVDEGPPEARARLTAAARRRGELLGAEARAKTAAADAVDASEVDRITETLAETLAANGYEPETAEGEIRLRNCPFHALAGAHTQLVCGMNLALLEGVVQGLEARGVEPVLAPRPPYCCVNFRLDRGSGS